MDVKPQPDSTLPSSSSTVGDVNSEGNEDYFKTFSVLIGNRLHILMGVEYECTY